MLKQRLITAIILIPIFVILVLMLPPLAFSILTALFVLIGAWEWSAFMGIKKFPHSLIYPALMIFVMGLSLYFPVTLIMYVAFAWWLLSILLMVIYPKASNFWGKGILIRALMGVLVLIPCWLAVNFIRNSNGGPYALLFLFILIWGADSAAYFVGKKWGKHKLSPKLSPGKSWEGFAGALIMGIVIAMLVLIIFKPPYAIWIGVIFLALITVIFSVVGDLFESMLKRKAQLKDSGHILPGHGGVLDRIDSLTAAAPTFIMMVLLLGKIYQ